MNRQTQWLGTRHPVPALRQAQPCNRLMSEGRKGGTFRARPPDDRRGGERGWILRYFKKM
jgi:hypothetical protein